MCDYNPVTDQTVLWSCQPYVWHGIALDMPIVDDHEQLVHVRMDDVQPLDVTLMILEL
jgi:hypothetical protein